MVTYISWSSDFCFVSWRLFDVWTSLFGIMNQHDPMFHLKINVGHCDLYFMVQWLCIIPWRRISCMDIIIWDYESVWADASPQNKCRTRSHIFHGPVILWCILKIFDVWTSSLGIMGQYDQIFKINVCHCDLYFMVHWFCLTSQRLFDGWVSYF